MCFRESSQGKQQSKVKKTLTLVSEENSRKGKSQVKIWHHQGNEKKKPKENESNTKPQTKKKTD